MFDGAFITECEVYNVLTESHTIISTNDESKYMGAVFQTVLWTEHLNFVKILFALILIL